MKVLVLNCGSSSIKYQLIDMDKGASLLAKGLLERIGLEMGEFTHKPVGKDKYYVKQPIADHKAGIKMVLDALVDEKIGVIKSLTEINACGHRVAHGGEVFKSSVLVGEKEKEQIRALFALAPLHNPANLQGIEAMEAILPGVPQVAVFDTSFHQTMPEKAYLYAIPYEYYQTDKIRRYGFHGTSHRFVAPKAAKMAGMDINNSKIISCHLGSGASICAVKNGQSVDTSMGFTPVEGLIMGSRCGDLDLGVLLYIAEKENMGIKEMNNFINKDCGLKGITGGVVDMRDIMAGKREGKQRETYAFDMFAYRVKKYIGAYAAAMGGVDIILFTGGIGENAWWQRQEICEGLEFLGAEMDKEANEKMAGQDGIISKPDSRVKILSVTTDEELVIAQDTYSIVKQL
ncbi:MAG TPA: acetate kinase [Candidatus Onthomorpha intestinigallinarum]|uniref:Acetate kinase n=1 Tax=Candidatus Onthomorpha intestinigallinarum TaxID=2840880 RepID=A0A9D1RHG1_9BACT|nr:acetate kinase [Candidatus Onthomorpha intestinigallinarum]